jgi:hypothetical protein
MKVLLVNDQRYAKAKIFLALDSLSMRRCQVILEFGFRDLSFLELHRAATGVRHSGFQHNFVFKTDAQRRAVIF